MGNKLGGESGEDRCQSITGESQKAQRGEAKWGFGTKRFSVDSIEGVG